MDAMERVLRGFVAAADPGEADGRAAFHGQAHTLAFDTRLPISATGLLTRNAEVGLGVDDRHRLVLRWTLSLHAERLTPPPPPQQTVLMDGVDHVDFSYLPRPDQGRRLGRYLDAADASATCPHHRRVYRGRPAPLADDGSGTDALAP